MNITSKTVFACKKLYFTFLLLLFLTPGISVGAIYKWVDDDGKTHYGSERPKTSQVEKLDIKVKEPVVPIKTEKDGEKEDKIFNKDAAKPTEPEAPKLSAKEKFRLCNQAKTDLQRIEAKGRIRQKEKDGSSRYLTPQERGKRLAAAKKDMKDYCR